MAKTIDIYWAPVGTVSTVHSMNLLLEPPQRFWHNIPDKSDNIQGDYRACKAAQNMMNNTFLLKSPFTSTVKLIGEKNNPTVVSEREGLWVPRDPSFKDAYRVDIDFYWIFYCEEPVEIKQTPPYMHKTTAQEGGFLVPGSFDISKWFRQLTISYHTWPSTDTITVTEDEPLCYVEFDTDKRVVLKQFEYTSEIHEINMQNVNFKHFKPNQSLEQLYERFTRSNRDKRLINLIKENLLE